MIAPGWSGRSSCRPGRSKLEASANPDDPPRGGAASVWHVPPPASATLAPPRHAPVRISTRAFPTIHHGGRWEQACCIRDCSPRSCRAAACRGSASNRPAAGLGHHPRRSPMSPSVPRRDPPPRCPRGTSAECRAIPPNREACRTCRSACRSIRNLCLASVKKTSPDNFGTGTDRVPGRGVAPAPVRAQRRP